jgi:DNA/RNA endonuclease YhcR with UshA esterase domain
MRADHCVRCPDRSGTTTCSRYNSDTICIECDSDERKLPSYAACSQAEFDACRRGDYNFHYGLSPDDSQRLAEMRKTRLSTGVA